MNFMTKLRTSIGIVVTSFALMGKHKVFLLIPLLRLIVLVGLIGIGFLFCLPLILYITFMFFAFATYLGLGLPEGAHSVVAIPITRCLRHPNEWNCHSFGKTMQ